MSNNNWISDKAQEPFGELNIYLIYLKDRKWVEIAWCPDSKNGDWLLTGTQLEKDIYIPNENVSHWQPLPEPPIVNNSIKI